MEQNTKDWMHYMSAVTLILSAIGMAFVSFFLTLGVGAGPLTYIGEALTSALALFGIGVYAENKVGEIRTEIHRELESMKKPDGVGKEAAHGDLD